MGPLASLSPFTASSSEMCGALGSRGTERQQGHQGAAGDMGGGRAFLPRAVPLVPAARAPLGCLHTTHPASGLVRGESLHHVQAVGLCPPVMGRNRVRLLTVNS